MYRYATFCKETISPKLAATDQLERHRKSQTQDPIYLKIDFHAEIRAQFINNGICENKYIGTIVSCPMEPIYVKSRQARIPINFQGPALSMFANT